MGSGFAHSESQAQKDKQSFQGNDMELAYNFSCFDSANNSIKTMAIRELTMPFMLVHRI